MIFDELVLHNFGVYRGEHRVALTPSAERPIVLFGALNGSGKTTFMEAMQLALYGKSAKAGPRGRLAYQDYLARSVNRYVTPTEGAGLKFAFRHRTEGRDESIRLVRTWKPGGKGVKETFEVWRNETLDTVATERWVEFVEDFIPIQISDLFFFDGEKIEGLADPQQSAALLRVGLHSLLGLDLVDHLVRSLGVVERRKRATQLAKINRDAVDQLDEEIAALEKQVTELAQRNAGLNNEIDQCVKVVSRLESELEVSGGQLFLQRKELEQEYRDLRDRQAIVAGQLIEMAAGDAPLLLVTGLLEELGKAALQAHAGSVDSEVHNLINRRDKQVLKKLVDEGVSARLIKAIESFLEKTKPKRHTIKGQELSIAIPQAMLLSCDECHALIEGLETKVKDFDHVVRRIEACERNLAAVPQEDMVKEIIEALEQARNEQQKLAIKMELLEEGRKKTNAEWERKKGQRQSKLEEFATASLALNTTQRILTHSARARETLGRYREEIAKSHMLRLEGLVTECFGRLHRKKLIKHSVSIDRESYELQLLEEGGGRVSSNELSAGERQLLAVSVLWALAQASGRKLPTVIDTPLGRLDSKHRHFLVENYFPHASHQVILFSTDEEITREYYRRMKPAIGREYSIIFDEVKRSSTILPGYFSQEALAA